MGGILLVISIIAVGYILFWSFKRETGHPDQPDTSFLAVKDFAKTNKTTTLKQTQRARKKK